MKAEGSDNKLTNSKISTLKKHNPVFKIVTVGDSEVGKTTFLNSVIVSI
jgi:GTPase SAR1 family protein